MKDEIRIDEKVELHNAHMIIGLEGWVNAGKVSTFTIKYLTIKLGAVKFGEIPPERFYNYLIQRPIVTIKQGIIHSYVSPRNNLFYWKNKEGGANLLLLLGYEPHLNWPTYTEIILKLAEEMDVKRIYTIGGYLADIPYENETLITSSTNNEKIIDELKKAGVELTNYIWSAVPMYVAGIYPKATYYIIKKLMQLIGIDLDLSDLKKKAETFKTQFEREVTSQRQMQRLIENLRKRGTQEKEPTYIF